MVARQCMRTSRVKIWGERKGAMCLFYNFFLWYSSSWKFGTKVMSKTKWGNNEKRFSYQTISFFLNRFSLLARLVFYITFVSIKFTIASRLYHLNCNYKRLSDSSLNSLKKDGLSVRNIGKPQVAFLFAFLLFISIDRRGCPDWSLFSPRTLRF